ncbi:MULTISPECIES: hypothetical protein [unclassified Novosphingobium]|uniref:hypothetical protein n=1 Tax=unclassified Novosphingobium TaxID=2644732 RepID=UPI00086D2781|nr:MULTISPECIES: hypothetical protein [unclassified Novosphingobium]MBN9145555.1 hypothetical protein [Novosphingobium sp.]ODU80818.1 MAG: hypothetical protein ABT10_16595 [Novosphingobium sp. SCN 63-17]OJX87969.1 MAG: hypothetical protein BGP00_00755 [Novosphingobium sp. 63-713]
MLPNIDLRIGNLVKALEQVILPALPASQRLARDQVRLVIGHLRMLGGQWKTALRYEEISFEELAALARDLAELVEEPQQRLLTSALKETATCDHSSIDALEDANKILGQAVDMTILGGEDHRPLSRAASEAVLEYALRHARRERIWFQANQLDPDRAELPSIASMLATA